MTRTKSRHRGKITYRKKRTYRKKKRTYRKKKRTYRKKRTHKGGGLKKITRFVQNRVDPRGRSRRDYEDHMEKERKKARRIDLAERELREGRGQRRFSLRGLFPWKASKAEIKQKAREDSLSKSVTDNAHTEGNVEYDLYDREIDRDDPDGMKRFNRDLAIKKKKIENARRWGLVRGDATKKMVAQKNLGKITDPKSINKLRKQAYDESIRNMWKLNREAAEVSAEMRNPEKYHREKKQKEEVDEIMRIVHANAKELREREKSGEVIESSWNPDKHEVHTSDGGIGFAIGGGKDTKKKRK